MLIIGFGFGAGIKRGGFLGVHDSERKLVVISLLFIKIYWLNRKATDYWYECARFAFKDPSWFIENHHAVRQAKRRARLTGARAHSNAWKEHRERFRGDIQKLEDQVSDLKRRLGTAKRDIEAYQRLVEGGRND